MRDGMDIINFSGGGPQADPRTDILIEAVANVVRAGVVPIISAGNDRDFFGLGTAGSPATAPDAISVGAVANAHVFGPSLPVVSPSGLPRMPFAPDGHHPAVLDLGEPAARRRRVDRRREPAALRRRARRGIAARRDRARQPRRLPVRREGRRARETAGASGHRHRREPSGRSDVRVHHRALRGDDLGPRRRADPRRGRRSRRRGHRPLHARHRSRCPTTWAGVPTSFTPAGLTPFGHALKPDVTAPGAQVLSSTLPEFAGDQYAVLDGTSFSAPHISGVAALLDQRHPSWTPQQMKSALMSTAGPCVRRHVAHAGGVGARRREPGSCNVGTADRPLDLQRSAVALVRLPRRGRGREQQVDLGRRLRRRRRCRHVDRRGAAAGRVRGRDRRGGAGHARARRDSA